MQLNMPNGPDGLSGQSVPPLPHPDTTMVYVPEGEDDTVETCKMTAASAVIAVVLVLGAIVAVGYVMPLIVS